VCDCFQQPRTMGPSIVGIVFTLLIPIAAIAYFVNLYQTNQTVAPIETSSAVDYASATSPASVRFRCLAQSHCAIVSAYPNGPCQNLPNILMQPGDTADIPVCFLDADATSNFGTVVIAFTNETWGVMKPTSILGELMDTDGTVIPTHCGLSCEGIGSPAFPMCNVQLDIVSTTHYDQPTSIHYYLQNSLACPASGGMSGGGLKPCDIADKFGVRHNCSCGPFGCSNYGVKPEPFGTAMVLPPTLTAYNVASAQRSNLALLGETGGVISLLVAIFSIVLAIFRFFVPVRGDKGSGDGNATEMGHLDET